MHQWIKMTAVANRSICGLLAQDVFPFNDTVAFPNDAVLAAVNVPLCVFAFLSNLVAIVAVVKTPILHKPSNILLCSLALADCLSGAISQPLFIARRLMIHRAHISCDYQLELYVLHRCFIRLTTFLSFAYLTVISFDRHYALSKPLRYRADASSSDAAKKAVLAAAGVVLFVVPTEFVLSSNPLIVPHLILGAFFILTPTINHFRMFIAIRQQSHQVADAVASNQQRNMILRREKKVAFDMFMVAIVMLISFAPSLVVKLLESSSFLTPIYPYLFPWAVSASFMNSYVNPVIYFWRNKELRIAMKSTVSC